MVLLYIYQIFSSLRSHLHFFFCIFPSLLWSTFFVYTLYNLVQFDSEVNRIFFASREKSYIEFDIFTHFFHFFENIFHNDANQSAKWARERRGAWRGRSAPLFRRTKNQEVSTGPLAHLYAHLLAPSIHLLAPHCLLCSAALISSLGRSLANSLTFELVGKWMITYI